MKNIKEKDNEQEEITENVNALTKELATQQVNIRLYLTTHSTHFIYGYMVKDHSDSERGNPQSPLHGLLLD